MNHLKKAKKKYLMTIDENDPESGVFALSLVESPAIESNFIYLSKQIEIVKLATVDGDKRMVIGAALIPNMDIPRIDDSGEEYDINFPEETVTLAAQNYLRRQMNNNTTIEHAESVDDISVVESWIVNDPLHDKSNAYEMFPVKGTWMVTMKINNDEVWNDYVKTGKVKGISLEGNFSFSEIALSSQTEDLAKEKLSELKQVLEQYLETITSISTSYPGQSGSVENK